MNIQILDEAEDDLQEGRDFYERQAPGIGDYFAASMASDLDSLVLFAGIHARILAFTAPCQNGFLLASTTSSKAG